MVKQLGRFLANRAGTYGYEPYAWRDLISAALLWDVDSFESSHSHIFREGGKGHKGFDFRRVKRELERFCRIDKALFTPFPPLGPALNSTAFFLCTGGPVELTAERTVETGYGISSRCRISVDAITSMLN